MLVQLAILVPQNAVFRQFVPKDLTVPVSQPLVLIVPMEPMQIDLV